MNSEAPLTFLYIHLTEKEIDYYKERQQLNQEKTNNTESQPGAAGLIKWAEFTIITVMALLLLAWRIIPFHNGAR